MIDVALARPDDLCTWLAFERQPAGDADVGAVLPRTQDDNVTFGGAIEHRLQVGLVRRYNDAFRQGRLDETSGHAGRLPQTRDGGA